MGKRHRAPAPAPAPMQSNNAPDPFAAPPPPRRSSAPPPKGTFDAFSDFKLTDISNAELRDALTVRARRVARARAEAVPDDLREAELLGLDIEPLPQLLVALGPEVDCGARASAPQGGVADGDPVVDLGAEVREHAWARGG